VAIAKLNLLVIRTRHIERLKNFCSALGIVFQAEQHGTGPLHYAGNLSDELVLEIYPLADSEIDGTIRLGFLVEDLNRTIAALEAAGAIVLTWPRETKWGLQAIVRDPDGTRIEVLQK